MAEQIDKLTAHTRKRGRGDRMTKEERKSTQDAFLASFALTANVRAACAKAGISRSIVYIWQEKDEEFSFRFKQAELDANDMIRAAIYQRGIQGYEKPVVSMGKQVYVDGKPLMEKVYSDSLLALLAKARMPEFREKQHMEHSGSIDISGAKETLLQKLASQAQQESKQE